MTRAVSFTCGLALIVVVGCAGAELDARTSALRDLTQKARKQGAYQCAPRELAAAEAALTFAELETTEGDEARAKDELVSGEKWGEEAVRLSPPDRCAGGASPTTGTKGDRDGDGIMDAVDRCPDVPEDPDGFEDEDGCPEDDNDQDKIRDVEDRCPNDPEDRDGWKDADGCPEDDDDSDGIKDLADQCPREPEDKDGFQDEDGCPDPDNDGDKVLDVDDKCPQEYAITDDGCPKKYKMVVVTKDKIELKQTVYFDFRKATIQKVSHPLLNEVAKALEENPTIQVRVEGHTDSRGGDAFNLKLSQARAESVRAYLIGKGVDEDRMTPRGFGESAPISDNRTQKGRDMNRRVEFVITKQ